MDDGRIVGTGGELQPSAMVHQRCRLRYAVADAPALLPGDRHVDAHRADSHRARSGKNRFKAFLLEKMVHLEPADGEILVARRLVGNFAGLKVIDVLVGLARLRVGRHALVRFGQVAVAVAVDVQHVAVVNQPHALGRLGTKHQQAILGRLGTKLGQLADRAIDFRQINGLDARAGANQHNADCNRYAPHDRPPLARKDAPQRPRFQIAAAQQTERGRFAPS